MIFDLYKYFWIINRSIVPLLK